MDFIELKNITRADSPIHYINKYSSVIKYKHDNKTSESDIQIVLEKTALGTTDIYLTINDNLLQKYEPELIQYIKNFNEQGKIF